MVFLRFLHLETMLHGTYVGKYRPHGNMLLSLDDEAFYYRGSPLTRLDLCVVAKQQWAYLRDKELRGFVSEFVKRHSDFMKMSATKPITAARISPSTMDAIEPFLDRVSDYALRYAAGGTSWYC
jgi:hypothetical protein